MTRQKLFLGPYGPTYCSKCADNVEFEQSRAVPDLSQLNQLLAIGPCAGAIYSWLFKYTQQHIAGLTENTSYGRL